MKKYGFTLIEVIVVLGLAGLVVTGAMSMYLAGAKEFWMRQNEISEFELVPLVRISITKELSQGFIYKCSLNDIQYTTISNKGDFVSLKRILKNRLPNVDISFQCYELSSFSSNFEIVPWNNTRSKQPVLIEYQWKSINGSNTYVGSFPNLNP